MINRSQFPSPGDALKPEVAALAVGVVLSVAVAIGIVSFTQYFRIIAGGVAFLVVLPLGLWKPRVAAIAVLAFLPLVALLRRLLIPVAGWNSLDPLLLIGPLLTTVICFRLFGVERRQLVSGRLSILVLVLISLSIVQVVNPAGGAPGDGVVGLLFLAVPLLWYFVGREIADVRLAEIVFSTLVVEAAAIAIYGLRQSVTGMLPWDQAWIDGFGFRALYVGNQVRAFATFSSPQEYATYLAAALLAATVWVLCGRAWAVIVIPLLVYAEFLISGRAILILTAFAIVIVLSLRTGRPRLAISTGVVGVGALLALSAFYGGTLTNSAVQSGNALVAHQVGGVFNPFDSSFSTGLIHASEVQRGFQAMVEHPIGFGTAVANPQSVASLAATEFDITDVGAALGVIGFLTYVSLMVLAGRRLVHLVFAYQLRGALIAAGILAVCFGHWLSGGMYAVAPLVWFLIGWVDAEWTRRRERQAAPAPQLVAVTT